MRLPLGAWVSLAAALATTECKTHGSAEPDPAADSALSSPATEVGGRMRVVIASPAGDVASAVRDALETAAADKRRLVVYVGAEWCEPCGRFRHAAESGELDAMFGDVTLLAFDSDRDSQRLKAAGYVSRYIPLFALPTQDGTSSRRQIEGGVKGDRAVADIAPRLRHLLEQ